MSGDAQRYAARLDALRTAPMAVRIGDRIYIPCGASGQALSVELAPDDSYSDVVVACVDWGADDEAQQRASMPDAERIAYELSDGAIGFPHVAEGGAS